MSGVIGLHGGRWDFWSYRIGVLRTPAGRGGSACIHLHLRAGGRPSVGGDRTTAPEPCRPRDSLLILLVADGIGITPVLPMHQAELLGARRLLLYGGRSRAAMAFLDEPADSGEKVTVVPQDERGLLDSPARLPPAGRIVKGLLRPRGPARRDSPLIVRRLHGGVTPPSAALSSRTTEALLDRARQAGEADRHRRARERPPHQHAPGGIARGPRRVGPSPEHSTRPRKKARGLHDYP